MYVVHTFTLSFKDNFLWSQVATWASTLACTSDQFCSSWRSGPNHTLRMWMDSSLLLKGPGRASLPDQALNRKPLLLSKLTLAPAIHSYLATAFFTAFMSRWQDTKTMISLVNVETHAVRGPTKETLDFPPHP